MKKLILTVAAVILLAAHAHADVYPMTTVVSNIDYTSDLVEVFDFNGNVWVFEGVDDWFVGDICSVIMDDNGTDDIHDDTILYTRYDGWFDGWKFLN